VLNSLSEVIDKVQVLVLEDVLVGLVCVEWGDYASVDSEESAKLLDEEILLNIGPRLWRDPKFLGISLNS